MVFVGLKHMKIDFGQAFAPDPIGERTRLP